jgi:NTE family protein
MRRKDKRVQPAVRPMAPRIGLALGSGSARGWAHIGVIRALEELGIRPQVVVGASVGALVGGAYASGNLDGLEAWARGLRWNRFLRYVDLNLAGGGVVKGNRLMATLRHFVPDVPMEALPRTFAAVATNLRTGREEWCQEGSLLEAVRASMALPGVLAPFRIGERWLLDGGLVNPVPVSVCRALGAQVVIAVNVNGNRVGRHFKPTGSRQRAVEPEEPEETWRARLSGNLPPTLRERAGALLSMVRGTRQRGPGMVVVLSSALTIMQEQIIRSRMAGEPPDVLLTPRVAQINLLEFDRAEEAIEEGRAVVHRMKPALQDAVEL